MDKREALEKISAERQSAYEALQRAADIAREYNISFSSYTPGDYFISPIPEGVIERKEDLEMKDEWTEEEEEFLNEFDSGGAYWRPYLFRDCGYRPDYSGWWSASTC